MVKVTRPDLTGEDMIMPEEIADIVHSSLQEEEAMFIDDICVQSCKNPFDV